MRALLAGLLLFASLAVIDVSSVSAGAPEGFTASLVLGNLYAGDGGLPNSFAYAPDGRIFIGRKDGIVDAG